jgi:hypothetical protein
MLRTKTPEMLRADPIYAGIAIDVSRVQPARVGEALSRVTASVRSP